jgi:uncharacterized protein (TIGR04255 family)
MPIPDVPHTLYQKNLLDQVICQLRFPPILKIDMQAPFEFQDIIRQSYPLYATAKEGQPDLSPETMVQLPPGMRAISAVDKMNYRFFSEDQLWTVNLASQFIALTTRAYQSWQPYRDRIDLPLRALTEIYRPSFLSRVGLRYINVIRRSSLGLVGVPWSELIQPQIAGILASSDVAVEAVQKELCNHELRLGSGQTLLRLVHGLGSDNQTGEQVYMLDFDFFSDDRLEFADVLIKLDEFNHHARRFFHWCVTEKLLEALEPQPD